MYTEISQTQAVVQTQTLSITRRTKYTHAHIHHRMNDMTFCVASDI